ELAAGADGAGPGVGGGVGRVLAAHAYEELVEVVDHPDGAFVTLVGGGDGRGHDLGGLGAEVAPAQRVERGVDDRQGKGHLVGGGDVEQGEALASQSPFDGRKRHALVVVADADHGDGLVGGHDHGRAGAV